MGSGFLKKKKQARQMQQQFLDMQSQVSEKLDNLEVTGTAGNGLVEIVLTGSNEMKKLTIKPDCVDPEDVEGLQVLIKAAYDDAMKKLKEQSESTCGIPSNGLPADLANLFKL